MKVNKEILEIIQDHTRVTDYLDAICCSIENPKIELPNTIPVCNDGLLTDQLTKITEHINMLRKKLL